MAALGPQLGPALPTVVFADVSEVATTAHYSPFAQAIQWVVLAGVMDAGTAPSGARLFSPGETPTRAQMAAYLYRLAGEPPHTPADASPYVDVDASSDDFDNVSWLAAAEIAHGWNTRDGAEFRPDADLTREQVASFLYAFAGSPELEAPPVVTFADVDPASPHYEAIVWLAQIGAVQGWRDGDARLFRPAQAISRAGLAQVLFQTHQAGVWFGSDTAARPLMRHAEVQVVGTPSVPVRSGPGLLHTTLATVSAGDVMATTGAAAANGWVQVTVGSESGWVPGIYLAGVDRDSVERARLTATNGALADHDLCGLSWAPGQQLLCQAAGDLERLNRAFSARYGIDIPISDSYRDLAGQVRARATHGSLAAQPGTSYHGWGAAVDLSGAGLPGAFTGEAYAWLRQQLTAYNWMHPTWAWPTGAKPEAWHLEYTG
ncbi:S-layer homology domain-containing protein [Demequina globuliformis]|uniref:S-layer homology domain-containing protein n=1 Tax=Demequina globuliformis TaxID=676202 RepID=UPI000785EEDB|nr:S-layer homology domain-containing protein [Demequina globuliformis]